MPNGLLGKIGDYASRVGQNWWEGGPNRKLTAGEVPLMSNLPGSSSGVAYELENTRMLPGFTGHIAEPALAETMAKPVMLNASGESDASMEAINRAKAEKMGRVSRYAIDSRSGAKRPMFGVDQTPNPYEHIVRSGPEGEFIEASGSKARPYSPR